jgi:tRNA-Thr(GGU) m(6)t(6)A37 methyltransferase TsaA
MRAIEIPEKFELKAVGRIRNVDGKAWIEVDEAYLEAMQGLELFSHIMVFYWFHENDTPEKRAVLKVHPCHNPANPLTGIFATHSPMRPNLIALTRCRIEKIDENKIYLDRIDAFDNSPLIDIKCYFPPDGRDVDVRTPNWVGRVKKETKV